MNTSPGVAVPRHRHNDAFDGDAADRDESSGIAADPARVVALLLIAVAVVVRVVIAAQGFLANDDFVLAGQAMVMSLPRYAFQLFNNHFMPGGLAIIWVSTHVYPLQYWPYAVLIGIGELAVGLTFYRLMRRLIGRGWRLLLPLAVLMFSPLTLEATTGVIVALNVLPMQIAMVLALGAMVAYARTGRKRHLISLAAAMIFGLMFFEKSLLIAPLVFVFTACLLVAGSFGRSLIETIRRFWPAWLVLGAIGGGYLALYLSFASSSTQNPGSAGAVLHFLVQITVDTVSTSLVGGPWQWFPAGDGAALSAPSGGETVLSVIIVLVVMTASVILRPRAIRAWLVAIFYVAMVGALIAATRLGTTFAHGIEGLAPRYVADAVPVLALTIGVAFFGMAGRRDPVLGLARAPAVRQRMPAFAAIVAVVLAISTAYTYANWTDVWSVKIGRNYLNTVQADLANAKPGTVFFDETVPAPVVMPLFFPDSLESHVFRPFKHQPTFVTETPQLSVFDNDGHIRPAFISGVRAKPPTEKLCGYKVTNARATQVPFGVAVFYFAWAVQVAYIADGETTATLTFGTGTRKFPVHTGRNQYFFLLTGGGDDKVELTVADPGVTMCTFDVAIGEPAPG
jgi:hypothetical protein